MDRIAANTPVIVGVGFCQQRSDDPLQCEEPLQLMLQAARDASADAGNKKVLEQLDSISVQQGSWKYPNPGLLLARELGCPEARSILSDLGVLQLGPLFELCNAIVAGEQHAGIVVGGEARYRELRSLITGKKVLDTVQAESDPPPDIHHAIPDPFSSSLEDERGIWAPGEFYALAESALRYQQGLGLEAHRDRIAQLYSGFSRVAANNPHAWRQQQLSASDIREPGPGNNMVAFPYTKNMMSQWNVNQAVAIIVCSAGRAEALGLDKTGWIYPLSAVQSRHVVALAQKPALHSHPGAVLTGQRALQLAGASTAELTAVDLYSCFPSAIQSFARDLELPDDCPLSATGSMAYAGGPFNHAALDSVARLVEVMRDNARATNSPRQFGLVTNISGMLAKQACALLSNTPNPQGFDFEDISDTVALLEQPIALDGSYQGEATVIAYTVVYNKGELSHAIAYCDIPGGKRTVVRSEDKAMAESMTREEYCGRKVQVEIGGSFAPLA